MGLIGLWGEHHSPSVTPEMQKLMGDAFMKAFKNKKILVRRADNFSDYAFGIYWDSWAHIQEMPGHQHGKGIEKVNTEKGRWKISPIEGETAYNWGKYAIQPGDSPNDTLTDPVHLDYLLDSIRRLHCSGLGWVANYNGTDPKVHQGAEEVQKAFGYRFIIKKFSCPRKIEFDKPFPVEFSVVNTGSAPLYENRPIEFSLLDPKTRKPVWKTILNGDCDLRSWLPGDDWDETNNLYRVPAKEYSVRVNLSLSSSNGTPVPQGQYIAALAVLDPIGLEPNLRFAIRNYFSGGRHPFCRVGVETDPSGDTQLDPADFDDLAKDSRLPYALIPTQKK
ncbi:MAG: DUF4832 domain-containing protein, partial [Thermoguttaceae bacterium]|nr:DUF4832 domain-containing protein [Thermoguttaceae bacterium]